MSRHGATLQFVDSLARGDGYASTPDHDAATCYGTGYALLTRHYLGHDTSPADATALLLASWQDEDGYIYGPELRDWTPAAGASHDREHLVLHSTCSILPVFRQWDLPLRPLRAAAEQFADLDRLRAWLGERDLVYNAWLEGNNLLFAGHLLIHLRDHERHPHANAALSLWFDWLDERVDPGAGLWGTQHGAPVHQALYGGYHQLLVYYHEDRSILYPERLVDSALSIQGPDGGFNPWGNSGACEDVDAVDILVNLYKQLDYRRAEIRLALRRCLRHIRALQNPDGGYPYAKRGQYTHMGIPATATPAGHSAAFPTWFRVHTLALIGEVLADEPCLPMRFNDHLSMGWHRRWDRTAHGLTDVDRRGERLAAVRQLPMRLTESSRLSLRRLKRAARRLLLSA